MKSYIGRPIKFRLRLWEDDGITPRAGSGITCTIQPPRGLLYNVPAGQIVNPSTGVYTVLCTPTLAGSYTARWWELLNDVVIIAGKVVQKVELP